MRKVFEHPDFHLVGQCESLLNEQGISTLIKNQNVSSLSGDVPFTTAFPELWILEDASYDQAIGILREFGGQSAAVEEAPDWACGNCGENVPATFEFCWNCDSAKAGAGS